MNSLDKNIWNKIKSVPEIYEHHIMYCAIYQHKTYPSHIDDALTHPKLKVWDVSTGTSNEFLREKPSVINTMVNNHDRTKLFQQK